MNKMIKLSKEKGFQVYEIKTREIPIENRVILKCEYGCKDYSKRLNCPPHTMTANEFKLILKEYENAIVLSEKYVVDDNVDIMNAWEDIRKKSFHKMLDLEKEALKCGYDFAFVMRPGSCNECEQCEKTCIKPNLRRFSPEAVGINLSKIMKKFGMKIDYADYKTINTIGILLLD